jgi:hypothetical protein
MMETLVLCRDDRRGVLAPGPDIVPPRATVAKCGAAFTRR